MSKQNFEFQAEVGKILNIVANSLYSDKEILKEIRKFDKDILLVINKVDNENLHNTNDFYSLGLGEGVKISAYHDMGIYDLMDSIYHLFSEKKDDDKSIKFSIVGRPNVGKSSNKITNLWKKIPLIMTI